MEFFEWNDWAQLVYGLFGGLFASSPNAAGYATVAEYVKFVYTGLIVGLAVGGGIFLLCLIAGGFGLRKMTKKEGKKHTWVAFLPFANTFYAGYVAGETRAFGQKMKRAGLYAMLAEIGYAAIGVLNIVASFAMLPYYHAEDVTGGTVFAPDVSVMPQSVKWLYYGLYGQGLIGWIPLVGYAFLILYVVFFVLLFLALLRKYNPRNAILFTVLSVLIPVRWIVVLANSSRDPIDYNEYLRRRAEAYRRQYGPYGPYGYGPYGQGGPASPQEPPQPFTDFGDKEAPSEKKDEDPFDDF